jgi:hypothetical protein
MLCRRPLEPILLEAATPSIHEHYNRQGHFNYPFFLLDIIELGFVKPLSDNTYEFCTKEILIFSVSREKEIIERLEGSSYVCYKLLFPCL